MVKESVAAREYTFFGRPKVSENPNKRTLSGHQMTVRSFLVALFIG